MILSRSHSPFWRSIWLPGASVASPALVFLAAAAVMTLQVALNLATGGRWISAAILVNEILFVAGVPLLIIKFMRLDGKRLVRIGSFDRSIFILLIVFMFGSCVLVDYATIISESLWPLPESARQMLERAMSAQSPAAIAWKLLVLCVVPGVCEEIFFRGFCQTSLASRWGTAWAVIATSLLFAAMHGNLHYMHLYFLLGLVFGWAYAATGSLWAPILCHVFNNAWTFINHLRGFEFPLGDSFSFSDAALALIATLAVAISARSILRRMHRKKGSPLIRSRPDFKVE